MKVVSLNIADVRTVIWRGKEVETGIYKIPVDGPIMLGETDVEGDHVVDRRFHGGKDKACYLYSADYYPLWQEKFPNMEMKYGMFGENITIEGMDDSLLSIGDIYQLGEAKIQVSQPRQPCFKLGIKFSTQSILKDFIQSPYPGAYLRVLEAGKVYLGDELILIEKHPEKINLVEIYHLLYHSTEHDNEYIQKVVYQDIIPDELKEGLKRRLNS